MAAMQLAWGTYEPFDPQVTGPLRDVPREVAQAHFDRVMAARPARAAALADLAARHGVAMDPRALGAWLVPDLAGDHDPRVSGLTVDLALWLGDRMTARAPTLRWELFTSHKKATGYQRPVLVGFSKVDDPRYYVDLAFVIASWIELAVKRRPARADFLAVIEEVTLKDA